MSIDEVMLVAEDYSMAVHDGRDADCGRLHKALRAAIEQHVAEEVARELEECTDAAREWEDNYVIEDSAPRHVDAAIRARAEKETK